MHRIVDGRNAWQPLRNGCEAIQPDGAAASGETRRVRIARRRHTGM
jgi:hypothetical protein